MKKFLAVFLALAMVFAMSSMAMAATVVGDATFGNGGTYTQAWETTNESTNDVTIAVNVSSSLATVYNVDVVWTDLEFTYSIAEGSTWDPSNHQYVNGNQAAGSWTPSGNPQVTVTNHSNAQVQSSAAVENKINGVTVTATPTSDDAQTLATAVGTLPANAPNVVYNVAITSTADFDHTNIPDDKVAATITITIAAVPVAP